LAKAIDKFVADNKSKRMAALTVLLAENNKANQQKLRELAEQNKISIPLTMSLQGSKGPGAYKLNPDVPLTVLVSRRNRVKANFALADPAPKDEKAQKAEIDPIIAAAQKMLGK